MKKETKKQGQKEGNTRESLKIEENREARK